MDCREGWRSACDSRSARSSIVMTVDCARMLWSDRMGRMQADPQGVESVSAESSVIASRVD
ncbi:MAG: hypothetical protein RIT24_2981 [Planctomycetota bacterium]